MYNYHNYCLKQTSIHRSNLMGCLFRFIKFNWNTAVDIHLRIVYGRFHTATDRAELWQQRPYGLQLYNSQYLALYKVLIHLVQSISVMLEDI